ncbi:MAG TPA: membrane dipeptidase, partial [Clostridia bacterium]|nr:membrane dipeptidase [Clostridia bacterium]
LIGINFYNKFLQRENENCFNAVYRRVYEFCDIGGENVVAFGSDFDGCEIDEPLNSIEKIPALHSFLQSKGLNDEFLDKLFYKNASDYFKRL